MKLQRRIRFLVYGGIYILYPWPAVCPFRSIDASFKPKPMDGGRFDERNRTSQDKTLDTHNRLRKSTERNNE